MIVTKKALPRRTFLRGLGTTLALPLPDGTRAPVFVRGVWRDYARQYGAIVIDREGHAKTLRQDTAPRHAKLPQFPCFSRKSRYIRAISHGNMAQKAVRWQPGREGSFAHTFPEEPTGELNYGAT